ncbi:MAG: SRPBCC family protein [Methanoregula sp.]|uniref:SRPBCC family protein n=1 Tax=Methanoregula sp. TaxID=2052170 RepID=UPI003BB16CE1
MAKTRFVAEPGKKEIVISRVFDAPRDLVFRTITDPRFIPKWWGPKRLTTTVDKMDTKPGGTWRFVQRDSDNNTYAFHGIYREVVPPERLVSTFEYEGMPGHELIETLTLEDQDGKTLVIDMVLFKTVGDRENTLQSGMESGAVESMERFAELFSKAEGDNKK